MNRFVLGFITGVFLSNAVILPIGWMLVKTLHREQVERRRLQDLAHAMFNIQPAGSPVALFDVVRLSLPIGANLLESLRQMLAFAERLEQKL